MTVKALRKKHVAYDDLLKESEDPFSINKVTGVSLNFPIIGTCVPTKVCGITCYFAKGPSTWTASLKKQHRLMNSVKRNPKEAAKRIVKFAKKKKLDFIRWNGGGDLFEESVACINHVAELLPDVQQWVVSRIPKLASKLTPRENVWVHISIDKGSWRRLHEFTSLKKEELKNWFWSYQCDADEKPPREDIAPVIFRDKYDPQGDVLYENDCELNANEDIAGVCGKCRKCFSGWARDRKGECIPED